MAIEIQLLLDSNLGIYLPQHFAEIFLNISGVDKEDLDILKAGPEHENYWDAWIEVLDNAVLIDDDKNRYYLHQTEDLWAIPEGEEVPEDLL